MTVEEWITVLKRPDVLGFSSDNRFAMLLQSQIVTDLAQNADAKTGDAKKQIKSADEVQFNRVVQFWDTKSGQLARTLTLPGTTRLGRDELVQMWPDQKTLLGVRQIIEEPAANADASDG